MKSEYSAEESSQSQCLRVFVFLKVKIRIDHLIKSSSADAEGTRLDGNENKADIF